MSNLNYPNVTIIRWITRIWSVLMAVLAFFFIIMPDPYIVKPIPVTDWIKLGFYVIAILGLLIAWRWEVSGGVIAIAGVFANYLTVIITEGFWFPRIMPHVLILLPGVFFLMCWKLSRNKL